jgi:hypothetical protein
MLVQHKKEFKIGVILAVGFLIVLKIMFFPFFGQGRNAFEASDDFFNSIAKGSTYFIPQVLKENEDFKGKQIDVTFALQNEQVLRRASRLFLDAGAMVSTEGSQMHVVGDLGQIMELALKHSDAIFHNKGDELAQHYGYHQREILFAWYTAFKSMNKALTKAEKFKEAKWIDEVSKKAVEVAFNFFGIQPESVGSAAGMLTFLLIFYVFYTMWWGYAILFIFDGIGLQMKAGKKKEV